MTGQFYAAKGSPEWEEHRHCKRKIRYAEEPPLPAPNWRAYKCRFCDGHHLTSKKLKSRKEREKYERRKTDSTLSSQDWGVE